MSKSPKLVFQDSDINWVIVNVPEHTLLNLYITSVVFLLYVDSPS